jgi:ATP synthase protein I
MDGAARNDVGMPYRTQARDATDASGKSPPVGAAPNLAENAVNSVEKRSPPVATSFPSLLEFHGSIADFGAGRTARPDGLPVNNSLTAGRRLGMQVVLAQAVAAVVVGGVFLLAGTASAAAALGGGLALAIGTALLALRVFRPSLASGAVTMRRFALGTLLKWLVVLGGLFLILVRLRLPLLPALAGLAAAMLANVLALRFDA